MTSNVRLLSVAAVIAVSACSAREAPEETAADSAAAPVAATSTAPNVVNISATEYKFESPEQIPAGLTTLKMNDMGKEIHHVSLMKLDSGKTAADLQVGLKMMKPGEPPPGWVIPAGGPNAAAPGASSELTMVLEPGNYALVCWVPDPKGVPHLMLGMIRGMTVTPNPTANTVEPTADVTITLSDYKFDLSTPLTAGKHTIKIVTAQGQPHEVTMFQLMPGKTPRDIANYIEGGMKGPPPGMPIGGVSGVSSGMASFYDVDLKPGDYAFVCFLPDMKDGKPHYMHGMVQQIKIS